MIRNLLYLLSLFKGYGKIVIIFNSAHNSALANILIEDSLAKFFGWKAVKRVVLLQRFGSNWNKKATSAEKFQHSWEIQKANGAKNAFCNS